MLLFAFDNELNRGVRWKIVESAHPRFQLGLDASRIRINVTRSSCDWQTFLNLLSSGFGSWRCFWQFLSVCDVRTLTNLTAAAVAH